MHRQASVSFGEMKRGMTHGSAMITELDAIAKIVVLTAKECSGRRRRADGNGVDICQSQDLSARFCRCALILHTLAILVLKNDRTRNLNLSNSVCNMTRVKFDFGSMVPVMSSIVSIYASRGQHIFETHARIACLTCFFILSITRSTSAAGHGSSAGAARSFTQPRVNACKSSLRCGIGAETDARMSAMSSFIFLCNESNRDGREEEHREW